MDTKGSIKHLRRLMKTVCSQIAGRNERMAAKAHGATHADGERGVSIRAAVPEHVHVCTINTLCSVMTSCYRLQAFSKPFGNQIWAKRRKLSIML